MEGDIGHFYRNRTGLTKMPSISNRVRRRLCADLKGYRSCLNESADRHHCTALAPQVAEMSNELFDRLSLEYCGGCRARTTWLHYVLVFANVLVFSSQSTIRSG
ncbi:hypothetical protein IscW_ISCW008373 [Ixodes scapularis]|uniref:Uncharacterized protein n=2 Tax=Ixodes scapularis TaxID=6945 RepID=B7PSV9_IXOSC|nr:hypothetical protein IscW_ISCW008373 [Ixodes scapularis]|eukprot:XP_002403195.1 hypothetical protein IscW_ISCW008373 [Ixodes scapularis]